MKRVYLRGGALFMALLILSGVFTPFALAAEPSANSANNPSGAFNVVVSPPSVGLEVNPGESVTTELKVQNQGLATEHVKTSIMKFSAEGQDGTPKLLDLEPGDDFASWAKFSENKFEAEPGVWKSIKVTISPPKTAAFGYYYAVIFSREGAEKQVKNQTNNLLGAVASLLLVDVKSPNAVRKADVVEFSTSKKVYEFLPTDFTVRMKNVGNTHVAPRGNIVVRKGGDNVALLEVNLSKGFILPDTYRKFKATWNDGAPVYKTKVSNGKTVVGKDSKPVTSLNWDNFSLSKLRFGKYDAKLTMVYDNGKGDVAAEANVSFWVIPWRIIGVFLIVAILILAGLWATVLRPIRHRIKKNRKHDLRR